MSSGNALAASIFSDTQLVNTLKVPFVFSENWSQVCSSASFQQLYRNYYADSGWCQMISSAIGLKNSWKITRYKTIVICIKISNLLT